MFGDQPEVSPEVLRVFERVIRKQMAPLKISHIHAQARDDGWGSEPIIRVTVVFIGEANDVDTKKYGGLWPVLLPKLEKLGEPRWPIITFTSVRDLQDAAAQSTGYCQDSCTSAQPQFV